MDLKGISTLKNTNYQILIERFSFLRRISLATELIPISSYDLSMYARVPSVRALTEHSLSSPDNNSSPKYCPSL